MAADVLLAAGLDCHLDGCSFPAPGTEIFTFGAVWEFTLFGQHVVINKPLIVLFGVVVVIAGFFLYAFRRPRLVPRGAQNVGEVGYLFIRDGIARDIIGKEGDKFVPLLFTLFFLIWGLNFVGIVPFLQIPVTSMFAIPVAFAALVYLLWVPLGIYSQGVGGFFKSMTMPPDVPKGLYVLLIPIEFLSNLIVRPFTHAVRLFANMFAGHLLITIFTVSAWYLLSASIIGILGSAASFVVTIALTGFEMLIQALQAYVFTLLTAVYISSALHAEH
ncbi:MAG: ATP synthase F0 subunit A [Actinomycetota bacterium]|nr:MAG: ATP synthase F0 subunit A [Actinomycetota bacterium]